MQREAVRGKQVPARPGRQHHARDTVHYPLGEAHSPVRPRRLPAAERREGGDAGLVGLAVSIHLDARVPSAADRDGGRVGVGGEGR